MAQITGRRCFICRVLRSPYHSALFSIGDIDSWIAKHDLVGHVFLSDIDGDNRFGVIPPMADQPALASDEARFKGEAVALIAGHSQDLASQDMSDFPITWTEQQPLMDVEMDKGRRKANPSSP